jgi:hypothetical protein
MFFSERRSEVIYKVSQNCPSIVLAPFRICDESAASFFRFHPRMTQRVTGWIGLSGGDSSSGVIVPKVPLPSPQPLPLYHSPIAGPVLHRFPLLTHKHLGDWFLYVMPFLPSCLLCRPTSCPIRY